MFQVYNYIYPIRR